MGHELGQVREGFLADMLLVDGDPLKDLRIMVDADRLLVIMKDGVVFKDVMAERRRHAIAAE